ncbi:MAG: hypothetical protein N2445_04460, partial [Acidobacteria bacterium]|nr:hypothetical protein [Acidobacteriota bacterium]
MKRKLWAGVFFLIFCSIFIYADDLEVLVANPQNVLDNMEQFDSIQILFSQKMVETLNANEKTNSLPPFISIEPPVDFISYWGNDRLLIIEPKAKDKIKKQIQFKVTVKKGTKSLQGGSLQNDYVFSFSTPYFKIEKIQSYRKNSGARSPYLIALFFNYDIEREKIAKSLKLSYIPDIRLDGSFYLVRPELRKIVSAKEPDAEKKFLDKINSLINRKEKEGYFHIVDMSSDEVKKFIEKSYLIYDIKMYKESRLLLIETDDMVPVQSLIKLKFEDPSLFPDKTFNERVVTTESDDNALFFKGVGKYYSDDSVMKEPTIRGDQDIILSFTKAVSPEECFNNLKVSDLTSGKEIVLKMPSDSGGGHISYSFAKFGFEPEVGHKYLLRFDEKLKSTDGEELGYPAYELFTITYSYAYVSFGEGEGVWEKAR